MLLTVQYSAESRQIRILEPLVRHSQLLMKTRHAIDAAGWAEESCPDCSPQVIGWYHLLIGKEGKSERTRTKYPAGEGLAGAVAGLGGGTVP